jgi:hypothetical protein
MEKFVLRHVAGLNLGGFTTQIGEMINQRAIDYKKIQEIIREIVQKEKSQPYDDASLRSRFDELESLLNDGVSRHETALSGMGDRVSQEIGDNGAEMLEGVKSSLRSEIAPIMPKLSESEAHNEARHAENVDLHGKTHETLTTVAKENPLHQKLDGMEKNATVRHEEITKGLDQPINLKISQSDIKREQVTRPSEEEIKANQKKMTVSKLLSIARK